MTTNTDTLPGLHRTEAICGTVAERPATHRRGTIDRSAGEINVRSWAHLAAAAWADAQFRRDYRERRADLAASLERLDMTKPRRPKVTCPTCSGAGTVPPADPNRHGRVTCTSCSGTGKVDG